MTHDISLYFGQDVKLLLLKSLQPISVQSGKQSVVKSVCIWWIFGWAAESVWQYLFQHDSKASIVACAIVLVAGSIAFGNAYRNALAIRPALTDCSPDAIAKQIIVAGTAMNFAWLTVASTVGILIALVATTSIRLLPLSVAAAIVIAVLGAGVVVQTKGWVYGATLVWAFYGISVKQHSHAIQNTSFVAMAVLGLLSAFAVVQLARSRSSGAASPLLG